MQKDAASAIGIHKVSYSRWESAGVMPKTLDVVERAAEVFGVNFLWLARGQGKKRPRRKPARSKS